LVGEWEKPDKPYPISVAEAQGTMIGNDFIVTSGFKDGYDSATPETYAFDMFDSNANWRRMEDMPFPIGLTHLGVAVKGMTAYFCGGYVGGSLGLQNGSCFQYDHSIAPGNGQWSSFAPIPDGGRAGGGMIYDSSLDALIYSAGSQRFKQGSKGATDFQNTWAYSLKNPKAGWVAKADIPFEGNHMNFVTATDDKGMVHHFYFGGQHGDHEEDQNTDEMYEYNAVSDVWTKKASVPNPLGHAAASARAIGCGFIVAGGRTNNGLTDAIMYYDIPTNKWTTIGTLTNEIHTNVCAIGNNMLRCETGWATGHFSWNRGIIV
jgi:N-acetylneuraminic acid mutarotase